MEPLKHLKNAWNFKEKTIITEVSFEVDFELKNPILKYRDDKILSICFE